MGDDAATPDDTLPRRERGLHRPVPPGSELGFVQRLRAVDQWPLPKRRRGDRKLPTATPFLFVPATPSDLGIRPLAPSEALHSSGLEIVDAAGLPVRQPVSGTTYTLRCRVVNRGAMAAYAGIADFYAAPPDDFDLAVSNPSVHIRALGQANFILQAGSRAVIACPQPWIPNTEQSTAATVVVHVHDPFIDPLVSPFNHIVDRHVARRDVLPDLTGTWEGAYGLVGHSSLSSQVRLMLRQQHATVNMEAFLQVQGALPANPQQIGSGVFTRDEVRIIVVEQLEGLPFTENEWVLSLIDADHLHVEHHRKFLMPGDPRGNQHLRGDLARV